MSFETTLEECSPKEVAWVYRSFLDDCLPAHLKDISSTRESPETILDRILHWQERLDFLNNTPLQEQIENYIKGYHKWKEDTETRLTDEQKLFREKCGRTLLELGKWEPLAESSKYYKIKLIDCINNLLSQSLYAREWFIHPPTPDAKSAEREIINRKKELTKWIEHWRSEYPLAVEIKKERDLLEGQLKKDLELLAQ